MFQPTCECSNSFLLGSIGPVEFFLEGRLLADLCVAGHLVAMHGDNDVKVIGADGAPFPPGDFHEGLTLETVWVNGRLDSARLIRDGEATPSAVP